jgi:hypothetical protein
MSIKDLEKDEIFEFNIHSKTVFGKEIVRILTKLGHDPEDFFSCLSGFDHPKIEDINNNELSDAVKAWIDRPPPPPPPRRKIFCTDLEKKLKKENEDLKKKLNELNAELNAIKAQLKKDEESEQEIKRRKI